VCSIRISLYKSESPHLSSQRCEERAHHFLRTLSVKRSLYLAAQARRTFYSGCAKNFACGFVLKLEMAVALGPKSESFLVARLWKSDRKFWNACSRRESSKEHSAACHSALRLRWNAREPETCEVDLQLFVHNADPARPGGVVAFAVFAVHGFRWKRYLLLSRDVLSA
jgi:hypothetical protein